MEKSKMFKEVLADAKTLRAVSLANASAQLQEALEPKYSAMFAEKLKEDIESESNASVPTTSPTASPMTPDEEIVTEEDVNSIIQELEAELQQQPAPTAPVDPNAPPVAPAPAPVDINVPPAPAPAPAPAPVDINVPPAPAPAPAPVDPNAPVPPVTETGMEDEEEINLEELLQSLNEEFETDEEEEEEEKKLDENAPVDTSSIGGSKAKPSKDAFSSSHISHAKGNVKTGKVGWPEGAKKITTDPTEAPMGADNFDGNKAGNSPKTPKLTKENKVVTGYEEGGKNIAKDPTEAPMGEDNFDGNKDGNLAKTAKLTAEQVNQLVAENTRLRRQNAEAIEAINEVKIELNEVSLVNTKLLYTNKLFKEFTMTKNQKLRLIEMFDLAKNIREVKLTYANLVESLNFGTSVTSNRVASITEGLASRPVAGTKSPTQIISEGVLSDQVSRFQKLAGIKK